MIHFVTNSKLITFARYPSYKQIIGDALSEDRCKELMQKTKKLQQWVKTML